MIDRTQGWAEPNHQILPINNSPFAIAPKPLSVRFSHRSLHHQAPPSPEYYPTITLANQTPRKENSPPTALAHPCRTSTLPRPHEQHETYPHTRPRVSNSHMSPPHPRAAYERFAYSHLCMCMYLMFACVWLHCPSPSKPPARLGETRMVGRLIVVISISANHPSASRNRSSPPPRRSPADQQGACVHECDTDSAGPAQDVRRARLIPGDRGRHSFLHLVFVSCRRRCVSAYVTRACMC